MEFSRRRRTDPRIDLTSLIDVVLNLVIFLLLTTTFVVQPGLQVNLPQAAIQEKTVEKQEWFVILTKDDRLFFNDRLLTLSELQTALQEKLQEGFGGQPLIIKADKEVQHGKVVEILDLAKGLGINQLAIATTPRTEE